MDWPHVIDDGRNFQCFVYHADALTLMTELARTGTVVDAVIVDPPYGLAGRVFEFPHKHYSAVNEEWDYTAPTDWMAATQRILKPGGSVLCFGVRQSIYSFAAEGLRLGWRIINDITWFKPDAPPNFTGRMLTETTERLLWFCPSGKGWTYNLDTAKDMNAGCNLRDVWEYGVTRGNRVHPTQKPLDLLERIVSLFTAPGDLLLDCFCGSGTLALAARNTGRRFIVGDSSAEYVNVTLDRLRKPFEPRKVQADNNVDDLPLFKVVSE